MSKRGKVNQQDIEIDNVWVVLFSPLLYKTFKLHINDEFCHSVKSIKIDLVFIFSKYIYFLEVFIHPLYNTDQLL